jgi:hypothetical protein
MSLYLGPQELGFEEERKKAEKQEEAAYEALLCQGGWEALCERVGQCIAHYEQIAFNGGAKRSERVNALERIAAMKEVVSFPKSFIERQKDQSED